MPFRASVPNPLAACISAVSRARTSINREENIAAAWEERLRSYVAEEEKQGRLDQLKKHFSQVNLEPQANGEEDIKELRRQVWSTTFIGGVFVIEAVSVILQVGSYKLRKKRIFKMAPLHHHFELVGWSESKIITRFWIASLVFALFALTTLKLR